MSKKDVHEVWVKTFVAAGISVQLLRWKGIEATEKLASSTNTKVFPTL